MQYCCEQMEQQLTHICAEHKNPFDCPGTVVCYDRETAEYGLAVHDGEDTYIPIRYCPWCGAKLAESPREQWFDREVERGYRDLAGEAVPRKYHVREK